MSYTDKILCRFSVAYLLILLILIVYATPVAAEDKLPEKWQEWLDETVVYIISEAEHDAFMKLDSEERRERFRELFWEVRDPTPGTEKNEYKDEHFRRLEHVNKFFGRDTFREGWRTDRGKMYILLGEPKTIDRYPSTGELFPLELWMYQSERKDVGLPNFFYLIFFRRHNVGELQLYTPGQHIPSDLVTSATKGEDVLADINRVSPELASAVVSLAADEPGTYDPLAPSFSSLRLLASIGNLRNRMVDPAWAADFLEGRADVAVEYQFINIEVPHVIQSVVDSSGFAFIDYAFLLPQESLDVGQYKDSIYGGWDIEVFLSDEQGTIVLQETRKSELDLAADSIGSLQNTAFRYADRLAVKPGEYTISIRVKNRVTKKAFVITDDVSVNNPNTETPHAGPVLIAATFKQGNERKKLTTLPFETSFGRLTVTDGVHLYASQGEEQPYAFCQVYGLNRDSGSGKITIVIQNSAGEQVGVTSAVLNPQLAVNELGIFEFIGPLPVKNLESGRYVFALALQIGDAEVVAPHTFVWSKTAPANLYDLKPLDGGENISEAYLRYAGMLAHQGDAEQSSRMLELAQGKASLDIGNLLLYAEQLSKAGKTEQAIKAIEQRLITTPNEPVLIRRLADLYLQTGDTRSAVRYLKRAVFTRSLDAEGLALLADLEVAAGNRDSLISYLREIMEMNPKWQELATLLDRLAER